MSVSNLLARALYDNMAESADELSFRRGEILMVVERGTAGLGGWWLCSLHGRLGIVPGNRLKLLEGGPGEGGAGPPAQGSEVEWMPGPLEGSRVGRADAPAQESEVYQVPPALEGSKVSWARPPFQRSEVYQVPPSLRGSQVNWRTPTVQGSEVNQTSSLVNRGSSEVVTQDREAPGDPLSAMEDVYTVPDTDIYNIPKLAALTERGTEEVYDRPSLAGWTCEQAPLRDVPPLPLRPDDVKPRSEQEIYSVPRPFIKEDFRPVETYDVPLGLLRNVTAEECQEEALTTGVYDTPRESVGLVATQTVADIVAIQRRSVLAGLSQLMEVVGRGLGGRQISEAGSSGVPTAAGALACSLSGFTASCRAYDPQIAALVPHLQALDEARALLGELGRRVEAWERGPEEGGSPRGLSGLRDLSQFAAVGERIGAHLEASACLLLALPPSGRAQCRLPASGEGLSTSRRPLPPLPEPAGKAGIQTRPLPPTPAYAPEEKPAEDANVYEGVGPFGDEQDYVRLQGKDAAAGQQEALGAGEVKETTVHREEKDPGHDSHATPTDRRLVAFYAQQCTGHLSTLLGAIDALFSCLRSSQPPRAIVSHARHVIVSAHKLVFIGDALSRQAQAAGVRAQVGHSGALLCQALKRTVHATKGAALRYPERPAIQEMVDKVTELSQHALRFTKLLGDLTP